MHGRILGSLFAVGLASSSFAQPVRIPFDVCAQSSTWKRPAVEEQSKIWRDPRYRDLGADPYQWTHNFLWNEPDSASITYENQHLSGVWTDVRTSQCPRHDGDTNAWTEIWALNHSVSGLSLNGLVYTISVVPHDRGYEIIQFRRPDALGAAKAMVRFVNGQGNVLAEWVEVSPSIFAPGR